MPQYTIIAVLSVALVFVIDITLKTDLYKKSKFWLFQLMTFVIQFFADGYLTSRPIYIVNPAHILKIYLYTTPLENFIFGFSMLYLVVIIYEKLSISKT